MNFFKGFNVFENLVLEKKNKSYNDETFSYIQCCKPALFFQVNINVLFTFSSHRGYVK